MNRALRENKHFCGADFNIYCFCRQEKHSEINRDEKSKDPGPSKVQKKNPQTSIELHNKFFFFYFFFEIEKKKKEKISRETA